MNARRIKGRKWDIEKFLILSCMTAMEVFGTVMLFCGLLDIKIL